MTKKGHHIVRKKYRVTYRVTAPGDTNASVGVATGHFLRMCEWWGK